MVDTIIACSTPLGQSGVAVIRISGIEALDTILSFCSKKVLIPRKITFSKLYSDEDLVDQVLLCYMPGPKSFTGEDVVEVFCHGNPIIVEKIIDCCIQKGVRLARHGEFSRRALENKKLSLLQAEALHSLIHAKSIEGVHLANKGLVGELDDVCVRFKSKTLDFCAELEARLDYPGDDLGYMSDRVLKEEMFDLAKKAEGIADGWRAGRQKIYGAKVALVGPVNAGKSSLFNQLVQQERALVSNIPGTTRDVVEKSIILNGIEISFWDTAGVREETQDPLERAGMELGFKMVHDADLILLVSSLNNHKESEMQQIAEQIKSKQCLKVGTHYDVNEGLNVDVECRIDSISGKGIDVLKEMISAKIQASAPGMSTLLNSQRQHELFLNLSRHLKTSAHLLDELGPAIAAEELTFALEKIAQLSGHDTREEILSHLFSKFCIGK